MQMQLIVTMCYNLQAWTSRLLDHSNMTSGLLQSDHVVRHHTMRSNETTPMPERPREGRREVAKGARREKVSKTRGWALHLNDFHWYQTKSVDARCLEHRYKTWGLASGDYITVCAHLIWWFTPFLLGKLVAPMLLVLLINQATRVWPSTHSSSNSTQNNLRKIMCTLTCNCPYCTYVLSWVAHPTLLCCSCVVDDQLRIINLCLVLVDVRPSDVCPCWEAK